MAYQIIWLPKAEERYGEIIDYLQQHWNDKVIADFIAKTKTKLLQIKVRPTMFRRSAKMNVYEALITKHNLVLTSSLLYSNIYLILEKASRPAL